MTIRPMHRGALVLIIVLLALAGCGRGGAGDGAEAQEAAATQQQLDEATEAIEDLETELAELRDSVAAADERAGKTAARLDTISQRLWSSMARVRESVSEAKGMGADASAGASSALDQAAVAIRDLAVLENRFDYHLRNARD